MTAPSYNPEFFAPLFASEDRHFWFRARNQVIAALARQLTAKLPAGFHVVEVGCGTGNTLRVLESIWPNGVVVGLDLFDEALQFARRRVRCALVRGDIHRLPFRAGIDLICLFDVLEHFPDDLHVLRQVRSLLAPGGRLLLTVPALPALWSYFDEAAHHYRRYEVAELNEKLAAARFRVEYVSPFMSALVPLMWLRRRLAAWTQTRNRSTQEDATRLAGQELRVVPWLNEGLTWLLSREVPHLLARRHIRFGSSLVAVASWQE